MYFAAKFLDPTARKSGSSSQELLILKSLEHECVIQLIEAFEPHSPAPSRRSLDPSEPEWKYRGSERTVRKIFLWSRGLL